MPVFTKPASLPRWADVGGGAGIAVPASGALDTGWFIKQKMPAQWLNWFFNLVYQWCAYLFDFEHNAHTWTSGQTFNATSGGLVTWTGLQAWTANSPWLQIDNRGAGAEAARQALFIWGANNTDPLVSAAGAALSILQGTGIGAALRASASGTGAQTAWLTNGGDSSFALRLFENASDGLGTALDIIVNSANGSALQAVGASGAAFLAGFFNNGTAPALKVENTGAGKALEIGAGHAKLSAAALAAGTAQANMISPGLVPKAWAVYVTNGAGAVTLLSGQNVSGVAVVASTNGNGVEVTWASPFNAVDNVCVLAGAMHGGAPALPTKVEPQALANLDTKVNLGHWDLNPTGPAITFLNAGTVAFRGFVIAFGLQ